MLFILGVAGFGFFISPQKNEASFYYSAESYKEEAGGPVPENSFDESGAFLGAGLYPESEENILDNKSGAEIAEGTVLGLSSPLTNIMPARNGLKKYKVQSGDTLSTIAAQFGISLETLRFANPSLRSVLRVGEEILILPVSGVLYEVKDGDSIESVAGRYNISASSIRGYNPDYIKVFEKPGSQIVLPNAKPISGTDSTNRYVGGLPDLKTYFALPARGWNWGQLHDYNAVDIADQCGRPIYASAEGLVVEESSNGYWNQGYGNEILIEHPNGTKTRYAHTAKNLVRIGDYVSQGDEIALIGNTGNTHGPTGCHLHFEVYGAKNPFAIR